jgi:hypothetical protein
MSVELEREHVVQLLCRHYAEDRLTTEDLEARLEAAYRARDSGELRALMAGLPPVAVEQESGAGRAVAEYGDRPAEGRVLSVFAEVHKRGEWQPAPRTHAVAVFSTLELDFREARILAGVTTIDISSAFAEVTVIVPPGLRVECDGSAIFGEFKDKSFAGIADGPDAAVLRITGLVVFGTVSVQMRLPGETRKEAARREKS